MLQINSMSVLRLLLEKIIRLIVRPMQTTVNSHS